MFSDVKPKTGSMSFQKINLAKVVLSEDDEESTSVFESRSSYIPFVHVKERIGAVAILTRQIEKEEKYKSRLGRNIYMFLSGTKLTIDSFTSIVPKHESLTFLG